MLSFILRIEMICLAVVFIVIVFRTVHKKKMQVRDTMLWLLMSVVLIAAALFPGIVGWFAKLMSIKTPSNLIFLLGIFFLLIMSFSLSVKLSGQAEKNKRLTQILSIERYLREEKENERA